MVATPATGTMKMTGGPHGHPGLIAGTRTLPCA